MWIEDFRKREGLELYQLAEMVNKHGKTMKPPLTANISDNLLHILERSKRGVTHPLIANAIAEVCRATQEQRDMIVDKRHAGTWRPGVDVVEVMQDARVEQNAPLGSRPVLKISIDGEVLAWYESVADAARREQNNSDIIRKRCKRRVKNEFTKMVRYTYRFADEWDAMTYDEKMRDIGVGDVEWGDSYDDMDS